MMGGALQAFQRSLDTTGHNIANVNTPGYSRQRVELSANQPITFYNNGMKALGSGVNLSDIQRVRDYFLDRQLHGSLGDSSHHQTIATGATSMERIYGEPSDFGIGASLDRFFDSWSGLSGDPSNSGLRTEVRTAAVELTDRTRDAHDQIYAFRQQQQEAVQTTIDEINRLANEIDRLNSEIRHFESTSGGSANDLKDARDASIEELSKLVDTRVEVFSDGSYSVYAAGFSLVDGAGVRTFPSTYDQVSGTVQNGGATFHVRSGKLAGLFHMLNSADDQLARLNTFADTMKTEINALHASGVLSDGVTTGINFFKDVVPPAPQTGASDFYVSDKVLASIDNIATGLTGKAGDGGLALSIANERDVDQAALGAKNFHGFYLDAAHTTAAEADYYQRAADTEMNVTTQIQNRQQSVSGVSIDDEMTDLMRFQRSYQAAARALTIFDQVTEDLIGMVRR
jgi:flagellar hook-associated protein 1 FlgK